MAAPQTSSRLELLQARFQQRQLVEREQKLLQLYDQQQQRAHHVAQRGSAGSNVSSSSGSSTTGNHQTSSKTTTTHGGKVRQMFDERRQTTVKGIDRSYPLEPLENKPRKTNPSITTKNGNAVANRRSIMVKRNIRSDTNGNTNDNTNGKGNVTYPEEITHETFEPKLIHHDSDFEEFYNENSGVQIEEIIDNDRFFNDSHKYSEQTIKEKKSPIGTKTEHFINPNSNKKSLDKNLLTSIKKPNEIMNTGNSVSRDIIRDKIRDQSPKFSPINKQLTSDKRRNLTIKKKESECENYRNMVKIELGRKSPEILRKTYYLNSEKDNSSEDHEKISTSKFENKIRMKKEQDEYLSNISGIKKESLEILNVDNSKTENKAKIELRKRCPSKEKDSKFITKQKKSLERNASLKSLQKLKSTDEKKKDAVIIGKIKSCERSVPKISHELRLNRKKSTSLERSVSPECTCKSNIESIPENARVNGSSVKKDSETLEQINKYIIHEESRKSTADLSHDEMKILEPSFSQKNAEELKVNELTNEPDEISLKQLDESKIPNLAKILTCIPNESTNKFYPRRKSQFEKSHVFRKLREKLDRNSPDILDQSFITKSDREKSPSPPKFNQSFYKIHSYPRRISAFEKSDTFKKIRDSLNKEDEEDVGILNTREGTISPPEIVKSSYEKINKLQHSPKESKLFDERNAFQTSIELKNTSNVNNSINVESPKKKVQETIKSFEQLFTKKSSFSEKQTTFKKLQDELGRESPDMIKYRCQSPQNNLNNGLFAKNKSETEKSRIFQKFHLELASSPELNDPSENITFLKIPTKITPNNHEIEISDNFVKNQNSEDTLRSVELLKGILSITDEKLNVSDKKYPENFNIPSEYNESETKTMHKIVKKDKVLYPESKVCIEEISDTISKPSFITTEIRQVESIPELLDSNSTIYNNSFITNEKKNFALTSDNYSNQFQDYERTNSVESALGRFDSIGHESPPEETISNISEKEEKCKNTERKKKSDSRRSSLHSSTASWSMKIRVPNAQTTPKTSKILQKTKQKLHEKLKKVNKTIHLVSDRIPLQSPTCNKKLFDCSESDLGSDDTKCSGETMIIDNPINQFETIDNSVNERQKAMPLTSNADISSYIDQGHTFMTETEREYQPFDANNSSTFVVSKVTIRLSGPIQTKRIECSNPKIEFGVSKSSKSSLIKPQTTRRTVKTSSSDVFEEKLDDPIKNRDMPSSTGKNFNTNIRRSSTDKGQEKKKSFQVSRSFDIVDYCDNSTRPAAMNEAKNVNKSLSIKTSNSGFENEFDDEKHLKNGTVGKQQIEKPSVTPQKSPITRSFSALSTGSSATSMKKSTPNSVKSKMTSKPRPLRSQPGSSYNELNIRGCKVCGRKFASDRISFHEQICIKTSQKKRKTFDITTQRVKGTELEPFAKKIPKKANEKKISKPEVKSNWRKKHEDFINAIRAAKQVQAHLAAGGKLSDLPPPPVSDTSDYIQCPHCGRKFNQAAAERHIPKCQHMVHNKPNPRAPPRPKR